MGEWWEPLATLWNTPWYKPVTAWVNSISHTNQDTFQSGTGPSKFIPLHNWGGVVYSWGPCELTSTKYTIQEILVTSEFGWTPTHPAARGQLDEALQIVNGDPPPTLMPCPGQFEVQGEISHIFTSPQKGTHLPSTQPSSERKEIYECQNWHDWEPLSVPYTRSTLSLFFTPLYVKYSLSLFP